MAKYFNKVAMKVSDLLDENKFPLVLGEITLVQWQHGVGFITILKSKIMS